MDRFLVLTLVIGIASLPELRSAASRRPAATYRLNSKAQRDGNGTTDADNDGPGDGTADATATEHARRLPDRGVCGHQRRPGPRGTRGRAPVDTGDGGGP